MMNKGQKSEVRSQKKDRKSIVYRLWAIGYGCKPFIFYLLFIAYCLLPVAAFAAEGGEHGGNSLMDWVWRIVNFAILVVILIKFGGKPLKEYFRHRRELIEKGIKESREAKELAIKALAEVEERLKLKDKEIEEIIASAKSSGERERDKLIEEGERLKSKILEQAKINIEYEVKKAKETIKAEAVDAAMRIAEEKIKSKMTTETHEKILEESLKLIYKNN